MKIKKALVEYRALDKSSRITYDPSGKIGADAVRKLQQIAKILVKINNPKNFWDRKGLLSDCGYFEPKLVRDSQKSNIVALGNDDAEVATEAAKQKNKRIRNWESARASTDISSVGLSVESEVFLYRGHYKGWHGTNHFPAMASRARISNDGAILTALINDKYHTLQAGKGYQWEFDANGVRLVRLSDCADYHIDSDDIRAGRKHIISALREREENRQKQVKSAKRDAKIIKAACKYGVWVCLQDSIAAGNCKVGTESFARQHKLDISKHYRAEQLPQNTPDSRRVALVILAAQRRQAAEMARGYAEVQFR